MFGDVSAPASDMDCTQGSWSRNLSDVWSTSAWTGLGVAAQTGTDAHIKQDRESFALEIPDDHEIKAIRFGRGRWCVPAGGSTGRLVEAVT